MEKITVTPAPGRLVRDPVTLKRLANTATTDVPANSYWLRRVKCGDCLAGDDAAKAVAAAAKAAKKAAAAEPHTVEPAADAKPTKTTRAKE